MDKLNIPIITKGEVILSNFFPAPWSEDPPPKDLLDCKKCGLYKHGSRMIWGEGNPLAPIVIILDNPGAREDKEGKQYVCGTRETMQQAAYSVGLNESDLYVTYILKRQPKRKYDKERTRNICIEHLQIQLLEKQPNLIFCLGNVAVQSFLQNPNSDVKSLRGKIHSINGYKIAVAYHPLAVRRRPNLSKVFMDDWRLVANYYFN